MRLRKLAAVAAALGTLLIAAPAVARSTLSFTIYKVTYEGSGTYKVNQVDGPSHAEIEAHFKWNVTYTLDIQHKTGAHVTGFAGHGKSQGSGDWSISSDNGGGETCTKSGGLKITPYGTISGVVEHRGLVEMKVIPGQGVGQDYTTTGGSSGSQACDTTDFWHDWVDGFSHVGTNDVETLDPLTAFARLTRADQRAGKVILKVSNQLNADLRVDPDCGSGDGATCTQSFDWTGHVTFTKGRTRTF